MNALEQLAVDLIGSTIAMALKRITDPERKRFVLNKALEKARFDAAGNEKLAALKKTRG